VDGRQTAGASRHGHPTSTVPTFYTTALKRKVLSGWHLPSNTAQPSTRQDMNVRPHTHTHTHTTMQPRTKQERLSDGASMQSTNTHRPHPSPLLPSFAAPRGWLHLHRPPTLLEPRRCGDASAMDRPHPPPPQESPCINQAKSKAQASIVDQKPRERDMIDSKRWVCTARNALPRILSTVK
jgi:hypothetical protein